MDTIVADFLMMSKQKLFLYPVGDGLGVPVDDKNLCRSRNRIQISGLITTYLK